MKMRAHMLAQLGYNVFAADVHGMGGWEKLGSDYQAQMIAWLRKTLK